MDRQEGRGEDAGDQGLELAVRRRGLPSSRRGGSHSGAGGWTSRSRDGATRSSRGSRGTRKIRIPANSTPVPIMD
jgi:hypothetical protein